MKDVYILHEANTIADLENWMEGFRYLTPYQQKLSNEACIDAYGKTNLERYYDIKKSLLESDGFLIESTISANNIDDDFSPNYQSEWSSMVIRARNAEALGMIIMVDTSDPIKSIGQYNIDTINMLQNKFNDLQHLSSDQRALSNNTARSIFGIDNMNLYVKIKNRVINNLSAAASVDEEIKEYNEQHDLSTADDLTIELKKKLVDNVQLPAKIDDGPMPFFTPDEMIQFGVFSGEVNLYSPKPDNDVVGNQTVVEWFENYKNTNGTDISDSYQWEQTLKKLYFDYDKLIESGDTNKILARKQSILELGWNPEIRFTESVSRRTVSRLNLQEMKFIDISRFYHYYSDNDYPKVNYEFNNSLEKIKPIFIVLFDVGLLRSKIIKAWTHSRFSHAAISMYSSMMNFYSYVIQPDKNDPTQKSDGFNRESFDKYINMDPDIKFSVSAVFVTESEWNTIRETLDWYMRNKNETKYNLKNILRIVRNKEQKEDVNTKMICSQFVYTLLKIINVQLKDDKPSNLVTPQDLYSLEDSRIYKVYDGKMRDYNAKRVDQMIKNLIEKYQSNDNDEQKDLREAMVDGCKIDELKSITCHKEYSEIDNLLHVKNSIFIKKTIED